MTTATWWMYGIMLVALAIGVWGLAMVRAGGRWISKQLDAERREWPMWKDTRGQAVLEYAVMIGIILVLFIGTVKLIGRNVNSAFSSVNSAISN